ncbi:hypothetical protein BJ138DRAFT_1142601 [Hygrophoropsis aurantiaca]|uniref:Uncharacterized protein n=1 Tax=Hygrophoropsis aurantiaca TaxID=72124 RepID=A0ACB8APX7_9AGAM|nr:hypothetical protein BJ138DRAFT_1142601 [Hygrophoropsis aurantiaca]
MGTKHDEERDPTASEKADSTYQLEPDDQLDQLDVDDHDEEDVDEDDSDDIFPKPPKKRKPTKAPNRRTFARARKFNREHSAAIRLLAAEKWSAKKIQVSCPLPGSWIATIQRVIDNNYSPADNEDSDCEHTELLQLYKDNWESQQAHQTKRGGGGGERGRRRPKPRQSKGINERTVRKSQVVGPTVHDKIPSTSNKSKTAKKPEEFGTTQLRAFLRELDETNMESMLHSLQEGGVGNDEAFRSILKWKNEEILEFLKQFEAFGRLKTFQWYSLKIGLIRMKEGEAGRV